MQPDPLNTPMFHFLEVLDFHSLFTFQNDIRIITGRLKKTQADEIRNYTCLIYFGTMLLSLIYYAVDARKWFKGPRVNVEHLIHGEMVETGDSGSDQVERVEKVPEKAE